jgi:hypothetical protein
MFGSRPSENGLCMASTPKSNRQDSQDKLHSRPEDPAENTRPPGNGDEDRQATEQGREKLGSVLGH